jgi:hypothetical protein
VDAKEYRRVRGVYCIICVSESCEWDCGGTDEMCEGVWGRKSDIWILECPEQKCVGYEKGRSKDPQDEKWNKDGQPMPGRKVHARHNVMVSSDEPTVVKPAFATRLATIALRKRVPEAEGLVPGACDDCLAIRTHREI